MSWGIDHGEHGIFGLELPMSDIDCDTSFSLSLEFIEYPRVLEVGFAHLSGFLFELLNGPLVDTTALVDQVTSCGGFTGVDVTDDDE